MRNLLHSGFVQTARCTPNRPALQVAGETLSYGALFGKAKRVAATLQKESTPSTPLTAVFADRSITGFAGILGALLAGHGYVPLNPHFPVARTRRMLQRAGCRAMVADAAALQQLDDVLEGVSWPLRIVVPERVDTQALSARWPQHTFVVDTALEYGWSWQEAEQSPGDIAYLLFTSGSTGEPKGVPVTHANATHFVNTVSERYDIGPDDRFSQMFDTTFDLSVFDLFVAWCNGASVYCPARTALLNPDRFIRDHQLTVWFSVPSVGLVLQRLGALKRGRYPSLRWSLFCGEPLAVSVAEAWAQAAPNSTLENLYGPTELTVACSVYRWDPHGSPAEARDGIVPIGEPLPGSQARVVNEALQDVAPGEVGELLMSGPQRTSGYWQDPEATKRAHVQPPGASDVFYRTGDRVRQALPGGPLTYVGRVDHQIKVFGHRVELGEIESTLRQEPGVEGAVAFGWPLTNAGAAGVAAFVTGQGIDPAVVQSSIRKKLQPHAVPQTIEVLSEFPYTASGKVDRQQLFRRLSA